MSFPDGAPLLSSDEFASRRKLGAARVATRTTPSLLQGFIALTLLILTVFILCVASRGSFVSLPQPASSQDFNQIQFNEARARTTLKELTLLPRPYNSERHTIMGDYLMDTMEQIAASAPSHNNISVHMLDRVSMRDVFAVVRGSDTSTNSSLLMVAHYDSQQTTFAAQDNGVGCSVVTEAYRNIANGNRPRYNVIFLLEAREESGNFAGVRSFLASDWGQTVRYFVNFDGREGTKMVMFRTTGSFLDEIWRAGPFSSGSCISDDIGHYLANTDFYYLAGVDTHCKTDSSCPKRQGQDFGFLDLPQTYHTSHDVYEHVPSGSLQAIGETVVNIVRVAMNSDKLRDDLSYSLPPWYHRSVYYDLFGLSGISYSRVVSLVVHIVLALVSLAIAIFSNVQLRKYWPEGENPVILGNTVWLTLSFLGSVGAGVGFGRLVATFSPIFIFRGVDFVSVAPTVAGSSLCFSLSMFLQHRLLPVKRATYQLILWRDLLCSQYFLSGLAVIAAVAAPFASSTFIVLPMLVTGILSTALFSFITKYRLDRRFPDPTNQIPWSIYWISCLLMIFCVGCLVVPLESLTPLLGTLTYMPELGEMASILFSVLLGALTSFFFVLAFGFIKNHAVVALMILSAIFLIAFVAVAAVSSPYSPLSPRYLDFFAQEDTLKITTENGSLLKAVLNGNLSVSTPNWHCQPVLEKDHCTFNVNRTWLQVPHELQSLGGNSYSLSIEKPALATFVSVHFQGEFSDISLDGAPDPDLKAVLFDRQRIAPFSLKFTAGNPSTDFVTLQQTLDYRSFPVIDQLFNYSLIPEVQYTTRYFHYTPQATRVDLA